MYSTLHRARCPGTVDYIRGDLAIVPCAQQSQPAARPGDTLVSGAFAALGGPFNTSMQETAALISADSAGAIEALGGTNLANSVMNVNPAPVLTSNTFLSTSAAAALDNI